MSADIVDFTSNVTLDVESDSEILTSEDFNCAIIRDFMDYSEIVQIYDAFVEL